MTEQPSKLLPGLWSDSPFAALRKEMDQALETFFANRNPFTDETNIGAGLMAPSVDIAENDNALTMTAELPGLSETDVDLSIHNGLLILKGEKKIEKTDEKDNYHVSERRYGSFQRSMRLPPSVDEAAVSATFDKGVLTVSMPKKPGTEPVERKIAIQKP
ncbi:Hsp20/alpha crystallin family protein [Rhizobium sp. CG5]|uniref:Hsp20/alpha crystallin family protein n=1 Tax=Rhizobium sp. CG5 TaxID=2726076 RepID=UPI0020343A39|nr:Hsp20/alpha crystallin family protein [Rhizobium sp. CG5]MCM2477661.1 Hsp20/alpha crystallin family protein [Rhizobium sp. CG5]